MERFGLSSTYIENILLCCLLSAQHNGALSHASKRTKRTGCAESWGSAGGLVLGRKVHLEIKTPVIKMNK